MDSSVPWLRSSAARVILSIGLPLSCSALHARKILRYLSSAKSPRKLWIQPVRNRCPTSPKKARIFRRPGRPEVVFRAAWICSLSPPFCVLASDPGVPLLKGFVDSRVSFRLAGRFAGIVPRFHPLSQPGGETFIGRPVLHPETQ